MDLKLDLIHKEIEKKTKKYAKIKIKIHCFI